MPTPDSGYNNGPDLVELKSNIGTWVAAGLSIVALVRIVGLLLALRASASDKDHAINAVQDLMDTSGLIEIEIRMRDINRIMPSFLLLGVRKYTAGDYLCLLVVN